jgi:uncharacterized membrane protein (UPF0127 family)
MRISPQIRAPRFPRPLILVALTTLSLAAWGRFSPLVVQPGTPAGYAVIDFTDVCGRQVPLAVDVATNPAEWQTGLMGVTALPEDQGELFDFAAAAGGREVQFGFWMEDTPINLSVAFVGSNDVVEEIDDMQADTTDVHTPAQPYLYAIEANEGWFMNNDIQPGSPVNLSAALALAGPAPAP